MLQSNSSFKLSKSAKRMIAAHSDARYSNIIKKAFIQSELGSKIEARLTKKDKENKVD